MAFEAIRGAEGRLGERRGERKEENKSRIKGNAGACCRGIEKLLQHKSSEKETESYPPPSSRLEGSDSNPGWLGYGG